MRSRRPLVVVGAVAAGAALLAAIARPATAQPPANSFTTPDDVAEGGRLYRRHCSRCHGPTAKGDVGPDLTAGVFKHATSDAAMFRVITDGVAGTEMIGIYRGRADKSVWQLVSFIRSLNRAADDLKPPGSPEAGRALFSGNGGCARCHMANGVGGRLGPDLSAISDQRTVDELRSDLVTPDLRVEPRWWTVRVTRQDGIIVEGLRMDEDTFSVRLMDADENLWSFIKREVRSTERIRSSSMPAYQDKLTPGELDDLIAYLYTLRKKES